MQGSHSCAAPRFKVSALVVLVVLANCLQLATASIPSLSAALAACEISNITQARCVPYPSTGICAAMFPNGASVYLPLDQAFSDFEKLVATEIETGLIEKDVLGAECFQATLAFACATHYLSCVNSSEPLEPLPILRCADICAASWQACNVSYMEYFAQVIGKAYETSQIPYCALGGSPALWGGVYQPPDVWGGRKIPSSQLPTIVGLVGQLLYPISTYNYTFANGSSVELTCQDPNMLTPAQDFQTPPTRCQFPMVLSDRGDSCAIPCPFPVFDESTQTGIHWAFVAPALIGLFLCVLLLLDTIFVIMVAFDFRCTRKMLKGLYPSTGAFWNASNGASDGVPGSGSLGSGLTSEKADIRARRTQLRASTLYAFLGSILGILYFLVGPMPTLIYGSQLSCSEPSILTSELTTGSLPAEPTSCVVQRASPFILQAIFNLVLYAMARVFLVVKGNLKRSPVLARRVDILLITYCVGVPIITLIIALSIDQLSGEVYVAALQLSRQATYCQARVSTAAEWLLVFVPFILTGILVVILSVRTALELKVARDQLASVVVKNKSAGDVALVHFMHRLVVLGLATFITLIIVIASTSAYTSQLQKFAPAFIVSFQCLTENLVCVDCTQWSSLANERKPSPGVLGLQLASESFIVCLFAGFFLAQSVARLIKEARDGTLREMVSRITGSPSASQKAGKRAVIGTGGASDHVPKSDSALSTGPPQSGVNDRQVAPAAYISESS